MAENVGPAESEDDKSSVYGDYTFESASGDDLGGEGFELPPWTDPPTGEIPKVLYDLGDGDPSGGPRLSSMRFAPFLNSPRSYDRSDNGTEEVLSNEQVEPSESQRPHRHRREGRTYRNSGSSKTGPRTLRISSRGGASDGQVSTGQSEPGDGSENVFSPPEEITLPSKRFSVSIPKLSGKKRHRHSPSSASPADGSFSLEPPVEDPGMAESDGNEESADQFAPSSFTARRERLSRPGSGSVESGSKPKSPLYIRVSTGVGLGAIVLLAFHFGALTALAVVVVGIVLAVVEFYDTLRRAGFRPAVLLGIAGTLSLLVTTYQKGANGIALVFACMVVASMLWYLVGVIRGKPTLNISVTFLGFIWIGGLGSFAAAMLRPQDFPHSHGVAYLIGAVIATVANDTAAYFFGSWFGRHKLAPEISPTKSWEGLIAGTLASLIVSALVVSQISPWTVSRAVVLGIVVAIVAPLGDLSESMIKRDLHIKDMGKLLPGHGGMLDRIDGLLFVLPTVYYLLKVLHLS